jgi:hypothetical protein
MPSFPLLAVSLSTDQWFLVGGGLIVLFVVAAYLRQRMRFKMPRKWFITLCVVLSVALHVILLLYLPLLPGNGKHHGGQATSPSPAMVMVDIDDLNAADVPESTTEGLGDMLLRAPPNPPAAPEMPAHDPQAFDSPPLPPQLASMPNATPEHVAAAVDTLLSGMLLPDGMAIAEAANPVVNDNHSQPLTSEALSTGNPAVVTAPSPRDASPAMGAARPAAANVVQDFANRDAAARWAAVRNGGGDEQTEAAVTAALAFLSQTQESDGRWSAVKFGAGREDNVLGQSRGGTGKTADSGVTGLALLAVLGRGTTMNDPQYGSTLSKGIGWLQSIQTPDGCLAGNADAYCAMYCQGIAALAAAETYAITKDPVAGAVARAALAYTIRSQHPTTGGWRYKPGDTGDLSQFGWQAMALRTGMWAGLPVSDTVEPRMATFLQSVRSGRNGGLAGYRPGERPTATMTAEALASRILLGISVSEAEAAEAEAFLLENRPGTGPDNLYLWYYASIALHQLGSPAWDVWNQAMKQRLLALQENDGSWPTSTLWGGYGGKVYTTSMGALCLEVYYRHLSIYRQGMSVAAIPESFDSSRR